MERGWRAIHDLRWLLNSEWERRAAGAYRHITTATSSAARVGPWQAESRWKPVTAAPCQRLAWRARPARLIHHFALVRGAGRR